jgi:SAM-dependent methyltransferase
MQLPRLLAVHLAELVERLRTDPGEQHLQQLRRRKRTRLSAWLSGAGIEVGALYRPLRVSRNARVRYVDRMAVPELRRHYPELVGRALVPVDIIGSAEDLSEIPDQSVDFVIANHLFEHLEYPIKGLSEFLRVLRPGGVVYMALPDARVGIDRDRELTPVRHLLDEHSHGAEANRRTHYEEWVFKSEKRTDRPEHWVEQLMAMDYSIHFHVWQADTFVEFLAHVREGVGLEFELVAFAPPEYTGDDEFIVVLSKGKSSSPRLPPSAPTLKDRLRHGAAAPILRPPYRLARRILWALGH